MEEENPVNPREYYSTQKAMKHHPAITYLFIVQGALRKAKKLQSSKFQVYEA